MSDKILLISADGHIGAPPIDYLPYLDPAYREAMTELIAENDAFVKLAPLIHGETSDETYAVIDPDHAMRDGGVSGGWDISRRLKELDRDGVAGEILHHGHQLAVQPFFSVVNNRYPAEVRFAGARAYHRWAADRIAEGEGRLAGVADPGPCLDRAETIAELDWVARHGFVSVAVPGNVEDSALPPLHDPHHDDFWAACVDHDLVLSAHAGWGHAQGRMFEFAKMFSEQILGRDGHEESPIPSTMEAFASHEESPLMLDIGPRRLLWQMMLYGVFDRHPGLRLVLTEVRADWLPATLAHLDALFDCNDTPLRMRPSEYWARHCYITPSSIHCSEMGMRGEIGTTRLMFGTDYPHPEGTWPNTRDWIRATFAHVPETEARAILGENAIRCYRLDRGRLTAVAARIGPEANDVLNGPHKLDERLVAHFDRRSGLRRPPEAVDGSLIEELFKKDVAILAEASGLQSTQAS